MTFLNGITTLLIFQLIGEVGVHTIGIPVPGPVLGMFLLFVFLLIRRGLPESLDSASTGLLRHLSLLFIPAGVGVIVHFDRIAGEWIPIGIALILSTFLTMAATALVMLGAIKLFARSPDGN
jgi:holin-like protein